MTTNIKTPYDGFKYLDHQIDGIKWMIEREQDGAEWCRGGILGDDMGLGKTWQTIGLLINAPVTQTLIVAPPVLVAQWMDAFKQACIYSCALIGGKWKGPVAADAPVFICSYDAVKRYNTLLCARKWDRIILDEGHYIRNGPATARYRSISNLQAPCRWILTGTPIQNKVSDFKNLALWLGCANSLLTKSNLALTAQNIIKRRSITLLSDKMPLPPAHIAHKLDFICDDEKRKFNILVSNIEDAIEQQINGMLILERYLRLHQFISHPQIYTEAMQKKFMSSYKGNNWSGGATKLKKFVEIISSTSEPTLVFCQFKMEMDILADNASELGYNVCFVRGGMTEASRTGEIKKTHDFVNKGKPTILLCQINAGNCGLNLQHLTRVIFYTQHWNPAVIDQAMTRSYRYGQTKNVTIHHLVLSSDALLNIDSLMLNKHQEKRQKAIGLMPSLKFAYHPNITIETKKQPVEAIEILSFDNKSVDDDDPTLVM